MPGSLRERRRLRSRPPLPRSALPLSPLRGAHPGLRIVALLVLFTSAGAGVDTEFLLCDAAAQKLSQCCGVDPRRVNCLRNAGCEALFPTFEADEAACIVDADCDVLERRACPLVAPTRDPILPLAWPDAGLRQRALLCGGAP